MNLTPFNLSDLARIGLLALSFSAAVYSHAATIPNSPLSVQPTAKPMIMLALGRDHRLFYEAYNDASDIDGDGKLDTRFKPAIIYSGLFDSNLCYTHNNGSDNNGLFEPSGPAGAAKQCPNSKWSGNWLNYVTTSRIDALRVVLYGGTREVDTAGDTILRRAYIPQDAHSWAKEYTSLAEDGYRISSYTGLSQPSAGKRHFFGNLTANAGTNCSTLSDCSNLPPWLSIVTNSDRRVWEWASTERPVLADNTHGGTRVNRTVRVKACDGAYSTFFTPNSCKQYGSNFKPVGLLHDFGETDAALFGLISGSYDKHMSGGRLRKVVSSFKDELEVDGRFKAVSPIVQAIDAFRIRDFNNGNTSQLYKNGSTRANTVPNEGDFVDWGNPVAEVMYEAIRYFAGKGAPTPAFAGTTTVDDQLGLRSAAWDNPYSPTSAAKAPWCARANLLTLSDSNISYDSDQLPGSNWGGITTDLSGSHIKDGTSGNLDVQGYAGRVSSGEPDTTGQRFVGESGGVFDAAPTAKAVNGLGKIRGLAPEEPTKRGSYYASSVSHFAKVNDLNSSVQGTQTVDSFFVALASPLPRITVPLSGSKTITLVPFAKTVGGAFGVSSVKGDYQPTNQIVDFYVESIVNSVPNEDIFVNAGRYQAKFRINFEDVEQGNDHDMDAIVEYTVTANPGDTVTVTARTIYEAGSANHRMGYVVSGSTKDGIYLVVQDTNNSTPYFLNVPPGRDPGYCDVTTPPGDCARLPFLGATLLTTPATSLSVVTLSPSTTPTATFLKDPMWYAAKWGGFTDGNDNARPDLAAEWDKDGDGVPDAYFFVQNPTKLKQSLRDAFEAIIERNSSSSNLATNSGQLNAGTQAYRASFVAGKWTGDVTAFPVTINGIGNTAVWNAASSLPSWSTRRIYMRTTLNSTVDTRSAAFSSLPPADQTLLGNAETYAYVRGDPSKEVRNGGTYRNRDTALGDIIHSSPNYDPDTDLLYVGANDGMLHAFEGKTGTEHFGVIPRQAVPRLKNLTAPTYSAAHEYFVDGDVSLAFKLTQTDGNKYLYSLLGRGGKGLMSLNVSGSPSVAVTPSVLWEYTPLANADALVDPDLGLMLGRPVFAMLNNGKAGLIVGNGYNSVGEKAVLYVFIINADGTLDSVRKLDTNTGGDNGLGGPAFIDTNSDGTADAVFAGDLKGNVWRFDISDANPSSWRVDFAGTPLFKARNTANEEQPITAPVFISKNTKGGTPNFGKHFIFFGTGSYFRSSDSTNTSTQSWYGIIDGPAIADRANLQERTLVGTGTVSGREVRRFSDAAPGDMLGKRGWYRDFTSTVGERIVSRSQVVGLSVPTLLVSSLYPINDDPCVPGGEGYLNYVDPYTGGAIPRNLVDLNGDGKFDADDSLSGATVSSYKTSVGIPTTPVFVAGDGGGASQTGSLVEAVLSKAESQRYYDGNGADTPGPCSGAGSFNLGGSAGTDGDQVECGNKFAGRISWREILKD